MERCIIEEQYSTDMCTKRTVSTNPSFTHILFKNFRGFRKEQKRKKNDTKMAEERREERKKERKKAFFLVICALLWL